jgi:hypothetical protein
MLGGARNGHELLERMTEIDEARTRAQPVFDVAVREHSVEFDHVAIVQSTPSHVAIIIHGRQLRNA